MNRKDLERCFFIVMTHAENCRCADLHHRENHRHEIGEECLAVKDLHDRITVCREYLKSVGLNVV